MSRRESATFETLLCKHRHFKLYSLCRSPPRRINDIMEMLVDPEAKKPRHLAAASLRLEEARQEKCISKLKCKQRHVAKVEDPSGGGRG
jgi:hypothetical protein